MKKLIGILFLSFALLFSLNVFAAKVAVIYDSGGKFDKSFNESAYNAAEKFKADTGNDYMDFEAANNAQIEQGLRKLVDRGASVVVAMGFAMADAISAVAAENPDVNFTIIDVNWLQGDNIQQFVFKEHEGSFLVGMIAAMKSQTGTIGFVGGMDIPLIRKFHGGYEQGAKYVNSDINVLMNMTGTTPEAWNNPTKGAELTKAQIDKGADVVYQAAGGTGIGVLPEQITVMAFGRGQYLAARVLVWSGVSDFVRFRPLDNAALADVGRLERETVMPASNRKSISSTFSGGKHSAHAGAPLESMGGRWQRWAPPIPYIQIA